MSAAAGISHGDVTTQVPTSNQTLHQTISIFLNMEDYLEIQNKQFVVTLVPTLSYLAIGILCGLVGNSLVFMVYYKRFKPSVTRTYVLAMSVCDLMQNTLSLPIDIVELLFYYMFEVRWLCKTFRTTKSFLGLLSGFILVAVAFDRQRAICSPHANPTTVRHAVVVLVEVTLSASAVTLPYTFLAGPRTVLLRGSNVTGLECSIDDAYVTSLFFFVYNIITVVATFLCIGLMLVSYGLIARQLWLHKKNTAIIMDADAAGNDKRQDRCGHPHTNLFKETSSGRTQNCSVCCLESTTGSLHRTVVGSAPPQGDQRKDLRSETAINHDNNKSTPKPRTSVKKIPTRTTYMMFVLTVIFIINYVPYIALVSVFSRQGEGPLVEVLGMNGFHIGMRSYFINSFINPLVYSFCSIKFRQECRGLFKCDMN